MGGGSGTCVVRRHTLCSYEDVDLFVDADRACVLGVASDGGASVDFLRVSAWEL